MRAPAPPITWKGRTSAITVHAGSLILVPSGESLGGGYTGPDLGGYLMVCGLLIAAILVLGTLFRRVLGRTMRTRAARRSLEVLDVLPLGGKQKLLVVRCYDRSFLLGAGEKELATIAELDAEEMIAAAPATNATATKEESRRHPAGFRALLARAARDPAREVEEGADTVEPAPPKRPVLENGRGILG